MSYGTKKGVRIRIGLREDDTSKDEEIVECLAYADGRIDAAFDRVDATVPETTPTLIADASEDFAAYYFFRANEPTKATIFKQDAIEALDAYIEANYMKGVAKHAKQTA